MNSYKIIKGEDGEPEAVVSLTLGYSMRCSPDDFIRFIIEFEQTPLQADVLGYTNFRYKRKNFKFHRWLMGFPPAHLDVSHIDSDPTNNWLCNLEVVTHSQNMCNLNDRLRITNASGHRGISFSKQKYRRHHLGLFVNLEEAISARDKAETRFKYTGTIV